jgi:predicted RNase H-like nuclease
VSSRDDRAPTDGSLRPAADQGPDNAPGMIAGVDGCRTGWVAAIDAGGGRTAVRWFGQLADILKEDDAGVVAVDIPVGLLPRGARRCDRLARQLLGPRRGASVFPAPIRPMLEARTWKDACATRARLDGKQCSLQAYAILDKIRSVDHVMTPALQARVVEAHPEMCFAAMDRGGPIALPKRTAAGRAERVRRLGGFFPDVHEHLRRLPGVQLDDVIDAYACLWTARRVLRGEAVRIPPAPELDERGLRAEIVT